MSFIEIKTAIDRLGEAHEAYKEANDKRLAALEKGDKSTAGELQSKMDKLDKELTQLIGLKDRLEKEHEFQKERIEMLEARQSNPKKTAADVLKDDYKSTFVDWIRAKGQDSSLEAKMNGLMAKARNEYRDHKDITIGTPAAGGFAVPEEIAREIERLELKFSPVRSLVKIVQVGSSDYKELVSERGASSGWVGEAGPRTATNTPRLREITPTHGELYAYPQISEWATDDIFFNVESWLADEVSQEFMFQEGTAAITGDGNNKLTGMLNTAPVATADFASPLRDKAAYQFLPSDTGASPALPGVTGDALIDIIYALNSAYRAGASWIMNSNTTAAVRKLKDANGVYLWQPGLVAGQPSTLLGYTVNTWEQMPDIAADAFPVGFGNWRRAYVLVDRVGLRITRDNVTNPGFIRFYVRRREGGTVLNNDAAKFLRTI